MSTTTKSMTFQPFRRYEPLWNTKPKAMILMPASKQNMPIKYGSVSSWKEETWIKEILILKGASTICKRSNNGNMVHFIVSKVYMSSTITTKPKWEWPIRRPVDATEDQDSDAHIGPSYKRVRGVARRAVGSDGVWCAKPVGSAEVYYFWVVSLQTCSLFGLCAQLQHQGILCQSICMYTTPTIIPLSRAKVPLLGSINQ